jgi:Domain of unknown function (DUF4150)
VPVTIKVNGVANSLVHKGSNGTSIATIPDVCKTPTPGGPVPMPYPNISQSAMLSGGTTTVFADGGMMIATKGSEFPMSSGDEAGVAGGVKSNVFMKESTWILYSFDVKMDGQNACRLTDKKFQNHENTADLAGVLQKPVTALEKLIKAIASSCNKTIENRDKKKPKSQRESCTVKGTRKHKCCQDKLNDFKVKNPGVHDGAHAEYRAGPSRLDVAVLANGKVRRIFDYKFNCKSKPKMSARQERKYLKQFPLAKVTLVGG